MKNIHILPTDKPSRLKSNKNVFDYSPAMMFIQEKDWKNQHIYITSDEEIKEGDWWLNRDDNKIYHNIFWQLANNAPSCKKIILTTDQDLIKDGVQEIDDEFLEWFVNNPSCEEVEVEFIEDNWGYYKIIIPKEEPTEEAKQRAVNYMSLKGALEPKQEIVGYRLKPSIDRLMVDGMLKNTMPIWNDKDKSVYFIRGHVAGSLVAKMKELQVLDLWFTPIYESDEVKSDWIKDNHLEYYHKEGIMSNKPKQETLEEAAKSEAFEFKVDYKPFETDLNYGEYAEFGFEKGFIAGTKYQAEKSYSEEEVRKIAEDAYSMGKNNILIGVFNKWFEQFKKK